MSEDAAYGGLGTTNLLERPAAGTAWRSNCSCGATCRDCRPPRFARGAMDTDDLVHEAVHRTLVRLPEPAPQREGAIHLYLRQAVLNRVLRLPG